MNKNYVNGEQLPNEGVTKRLDAADCSVCTRLPDTLRVENGGGFGFVCIWREKGDPLDDGSDHARKCTVEEWLSKPENFGGEWYIDGGWGGPPGPIKVKWDTVAKQWINCGFPPWK